MNASKTELLEIHDDTALFREALRFTSAETGFIPRLIEKDFDTSAEGDAARRAIGEQLSASLAQEWKSTGAALGYRYEGSPIIVPDGAPEPADEVTHYTQAARPGHRAPHGWLSDGRSTIDLFGDGFVLVRFDRRFAAEPLLHAARQRSIPMTLVDIDNTDIAALYERAAAVVRPDGHVAWRGDHLPADNTGSNRCSGDYRQLP
jgi:hypothetical protein